MRGNPKNPRVVYEQIFPRILEDFSRNKVGKEAKVADIGCARGFLLSLLEILDCVLLLDVIEHLESPFYILKKVFRILKTNGIIIMIPNANTIGRLWVRKWFGISDISHLYLFTPFSLKILVERAGFKVNRLETLFYLCLNSSKKLPIKLA